MLKHMRVQTQMSGTSRQNHSKINMHSSTPERGQANKTQATTHERKHKDRKYEMKYDTQGKTFTIKQELCDSIYGSIGW